MSGDGGGPVKVAKAVAKKTVIHRPSGSTTESEEDAPEGMCHECRKPLGDEEVPVWRERLMHAKCFRCTGCRKPIHRYLSVVEAQPYGSCCFPLADPACTACAKPATGRDLLEASGQLYHMACFRCNACGQRIPFGAEAVAVRGKAFHPTCLRCSLCAVAITRKAATHSNGDLLCPPCADKAIAAVVCTGCGVGVGKSGVSALGQPWHPACLLCRRCGHLIIGDVGPGPTCAPCHNRHQAALLDIL